ncbi:LOW QUALITY PROTEIN: hypothetical protein BRARA_B01724 [Brassica rapa]|uniref:F-box domain-containing protein n=1 Tax=Brassica campestris TaxID=3711 RepID=A0A398AH87_BRACM|nr:LOW QUALITY PROTEIN: hypothetical protein BRARA_B01724 [Brassica rapa]
MIMSLPEDIIINILARVPRCDYPTVSLVSNTLVASSDIYTIRSLLGCTEHFLYVVLYNRDHKDYRLYTLCRKANGKHSRLALIPWLPAVPRRGRFVAVGSKIYVFGVINDNYDNMTSTAYSIDCRSHTVQPLPSMPHLFRFETVADIIDDKIYVIGRNYLKEITVVVVVFNTKTQMWEPGMTILDKPIYGMDFVYDPNETKWETPDETLSSKKWYHACFIDDVMYYYDLVENKLIAYDSKKRCWKAVEGLEELLAVIRVRKLFKTLRYGERLLFLFSIEETIGVAEEICCAEISMERRQGGQIFGKVEWFDRDLITGNFDVIKPLDVML